MVKRKGTRLLQIVQVLAQVDARLSADRKESEAKGAFLSSGLSEEIMAKVCFKHIIYINAFTFQSDNLTYVFFQVLSQVDAKLKAEKASASSNKSELDAITKQITAKVCEY